MTNILLIILAIAVICLILGRRNVAKWLKIGRAQATKATKAAANADPTAMLQQEIDDATAQLGRAKRGVETYKAFVNRLTRQVEANKADVVKYQSRVDHFLEEGTQDRAEGEFANLQRVQNDLKENTAQLEEAKTEYSRQMQDMQDATRSIRDAEERARTMGAKLELAKARKEAKGLVASASGASIGGDLNSSLKDAEDALQRQIDEADASTEVTEDLMSESREDAAVEAEIERKANKSAFADYVKSKQPETANAS